MLQYMYTLLHFALGEVLSCERVIELHTLMDLTVRSGNIQKLLFGRVQCWDYIMYNILYMKCIMIKFPFRFSFYIHMV